MCCVCLSRSITKERLQINAAASFGHIDDGPINKTSIVIPEIKRKRRQSRA